MSIKSSKFTIGVLASVCLVGAASAQQAADDRFTPRVYGSLAVTPAQISQDAARISGASTTRNVIVQPVSTTGNTRIVPSSTPTGTYTSATYSTGAVEAEAQRVIAFQNSISPSISESYTLEGAEYNVVPQERRYEIELFEPVAAPVLASIGTTIQPVQSYATHSVTASQTHYVDEGDTLYNISKRYNTNVDTLRTSNNLTGNNISIGQILTIPSTSRHVLASSSVEAVDAVNRRPIVQSNVIRTVQPVPSRGVYAVLPKDTLYSISKRACVTVEGIQAQNGLGGSTEISPGQRLNMPAGHCLN